MSRGASATRYGDIRVCAPHIATAAALRPTRRLMPATRL